MSRKPGQDEDSVIPVRTKEDLLAEDRADGQTHIVRKRLHLWIPIFLTVALLLLVGLTAGRGHLVSLVVTAVSSFFFAGKFIILTGVGHPDLGAWELALMVFYMDVLTAFLLAYNLDVMYRIPHMGPRMSRLEDYGRYTLEEKPYLRRVSFVGLVLFVLFPIAATGAVGGSLFGRLLGMRPYRIVLGIAVGSVLGCTTMALGTQAIGEAAESVRHEWWFQASGLLVVALLVLFLLVRYRAIEREIEARKVRPERSEVRG